MQILSVDLKAQYDSIKDDMAEAIRGVLESATSSVGSLCNRSTRSRRGAANGTDALRIALRASGIDNGG